MRAAAAQLSLGELLRRRAATGPGAPALRLGDRVATYGELDDRAGRLAVALRDLEVGPGDRVGVWMHNGIEMIETLFAIHKLGAAAVPLNFRLAAPEAAFIVEDAGLRGMVGDQTLLDLGGPGLGVDWRLAVTGESDSSYEQAIADAPGPCEPIAVDDDTAAFVMYTSGTTGRPKGAVRATRISSPIHGRGHSKWTSGAGTSTRRASRCFTSAAWSGYTRFCCSATASCSSPAAASIPRPPSI